tara:strand:+ start:7254 stop:7793 length:540 start_codon:yes stop_codon:yes gene_type:complete
LKLNKILDSCIEEWNNVLRNKKHPYRFFTLATSYNNMPSIRIVVLRDFNFDTMDFTIYTDARSSKIFSIKNNAKISLLFYDSEKRIQVRVQANCILFQEDDLLFEKQPLDSQKAYNTDLAPGTPIDSITSVSFLKKENHFIKLVFRANEIDFLKLNKDNHVRAYFKFTNSNWQGEFRVP